MTEAVTTPAWDTKISAHSVLRSAGVAWFIPAFVGQWLFAWHVAGTYFIPAFGGDTSAWTKRLYVGLVEGDAVGNAALAAHLAIALIITIAGTLQLVPQIRAALPVFHRWNGRIYIGVAFLTSIAALYMEATRDTFGPDILEVAVSINAVLIMTFAAIALRLAMARRIDAHLRWALRLFIAVSGVWFMRVMYSFLNVVWPGPVPGVTEDMSGPLNVVIGFASYLLPLAVLEVYLVAKRSPNGAVKLASAALVFVSAVTTAIGVWGYAADQLFA